MPAKSKAKSEVNGFVYVAVGIAAVGGLLFGYDTGVTSGAVLFIKNQFSLSRTMEEIVVSSVLVGAVAGAAPGGALTGRLGRRKMIIVAGIIFTASAIGTALAPSVGWLVTARIVSGIGIGIASFISPMYIAELVPAKVRGSLVAVNMLAITSGIVVGWCPATTATKSAPTRQKRGFREFIAAVRHELPDTARHFSAERRSRRKDQGRVAVSEGHHP